MDSAKLNSLRKSENLSPWQQDQHQKRHQNKEFFMNLKVNHIDPWKHFQGPEQEEIRKMIPNMPFCQTKKTTNDFLRDQQMMKSRELFNKFS